MRDADNLTVISHYGTIRQKKKCKFDRQNAQRLELEFV